MDNDDFDMIMTTRGSPLRWTVITTVFCDFCTIVILCMSSTLFVGQSDYDAWVKTQVVCVKSF